MTEASRDDMRMTIGTLEGYAASVDLMLCQSLHVLLKCTPAAARAIFYTLDSFPARKTLLTRVAEAMGDEKDQEMIGKMLTSAERGLVWLIVGIVAASIPHEVAQLFGL